MSPLRVLLAAALIASAIGCSRANAPPDVVLGRVGVASRMAAARPEQEANPRRLETHTRNALAATPEGFEVEVPRGATQLAFSSAVTGPADPAPVRFLVEVRTGASQEWRALAEPEHSDASWRDHEVALPDAGSARTLHFRADAAAPREALWGSILLLGPAAGADRVARAGILLVSLDTLGASYLGAFSGRPDVSPNLDRFLAQGTSFRRAFAQYGNTLVSHASLFSAMYPRRHGVYGGVGARLQSSLVEALADAGYRTVAFTEGGYVSAGFGFGRGFDAYDDGSLELAGHAERGATETFARAGDWVAAHQDEQTFVFLHSYEVHAPYLPRDDDARAVAERTTPGDARLFTRQEQALQRRMQPRRGLPPRDLDRLRALYLAEVHTLDAALGRLLARLDAEGLDERTLVAITADHGEQFGEWGRVGHGQSLHNRVLHVPLGLRGPGVPGAKTVDAPVQLVDLMPTLLELVGVSAAGPHDGRSMTPLLRGDEPAGSRIAISEQQNDEVDCLQPDAAEWCHRVERVAVQDERWKLVSSRFPRWTQLYDLAADPLEERDVSETQRTQLSRLGRAIVAYRSSAETPPDDATTTPPDVDADTLERLRELGYVEEP